MARRIVLPLCVSALAVASCNRPAQSHLLDPGAAIEACLEAKANDQPERTIDVCNPVIDAKPAVAKDAELADALIQRGVALRELHQLERSRADLERAVTLASKNDHAMRMLAWTLREMKEFDRADTLYTDALQINDEAQGRLSRCVVRGDGLGFWDDAVDDCRRSLEFEPSPDVYFFLTNALRHAEKLEEAADIGWIGIERPDAERRTFAELAAVLVLLDRPEEAANVRALAAQRFPTDNKDQL